ncbi:MAG TPA: glycosyltransferase family 39 protein [Nevskia sp.]|nr:glycosyltransferase family 39 protein [Nevskia sp.]
MSEAQRLPAWHVFFLLAALLLGFWSRLGTVPLFDLDEGAFSEATIEMLDSGNYLTTTLNGEPRYDKPILIYWLQAASVKAFGRTEFAFRFPSALCASLWLLAVYAFTWSFTRERRAALLAAGSLALGLMASVIGHAAIADALLDLLLALTMLDIYRHCVAPSWPRLLRIYLWMGLGFLAKGPVAVALPLAASLLFYLWQRRPLAWLKAVFNPLGWLVFAAVVATWVWPLVRQDHGEFLRHFLFEHNLGRYENTLQGHGGHPWYYLVWLPVIVLPFTALLWPVLRRAARPDPLDGYLLIWFLLVFVFFSFSGTQLPHYLLYGCTPLFILFGRSWREAPGRVWSLLPALLLALLLAALPWALPRIPVPPQRLYESGILSLAAASFTSTYYVLSALALLAVIGLMAWRRAEAWNALLGAGLALGLLVWYGVVPVVAAAQQEPVRDAALRARELNLPVVSYHTFLPSFSVYRGAVTPNRLPAPGELVFVRLDRLAELQQELGDQVTLVPEFRRGGVALLQRPGAADSGRPTP